MTRSDAIVLDAIAGTFHGDALFFFASRARWRFASAAHSSRRIFARASFSASSRRLIPSQNSAFTPVAGEALGGDGRTTALRAAERAAETRASRSERAEDRDARRVGVDRGFFEPASFDIGTDVCAAPGSNDDTHKMRVVVPPRAFARVPLFAEGDGSPSSPGRGDDDADSEVLRVSRDTFAELSLRGAAEGARSEEGDEPDVEDDGLEARV